MHSGPLSNARADQVWSMLAEEVRPGPVVQRLTTEAVGHVLACDVRTTFDFPPYDRSAMDGYAVRSADLRGGSATLRCLGLVRAGGDESPTCAPGTCVRINTGGALPSGADAVIMVERSLELGDGRVELRDSPRPEQNIERRGAILRRGELIIRAGSRIAAGSVAAIVAAGVPRVSVLRRPRVAVLSTGDELAPADAAELRRGQVHDSNAVAIATLSAAAGADVELLGRAPDETDVLRDRLAAGLEFDVLCVTGGMSRGTHDLVPPVLDALGVRWRVESLFLKPGKPTRIGRATGGAWVVGLPGNPVSCAVCFILFGRVIIAGLQGLPVRAPLHLLGELDADLPATGSRPMYHPAEWHVVTGGKSCVTPLPWRGSGDPFGLAASNALVYRDAAAPPAMRGEPVRFIPMDLPS